MTDRLSDDELDRLERTELGRRAAAELRTRPGEPWPLGWEGWR